MSHYIYTKEGVQFAMGLNHITEVNYYLKKAEKLGLKPSKVIGGVELYDIDIVMGNSLSLSPKVANNTIYSKEELRIFATGHLF